MVDPEGNEGGGEGGREEGEGGREGGRGTGDIGLCRPDPRVCVALSFLLYPLKTQTKKTLTLPPSPSLLPPSLHSSPLPH